MPLEWIFELGSELTRSQPCKGQSEEFSGCYSGKYHKGISCYIQEQKEGQCDWITVREGVALQWSYHA